MIRVSSSCFALLGVGHVVRHGERLDDLRADGEVERVVLAIGDLQSRRQADEAMLGGVVGEEGRVDVVGNDAGDRLLRAAVPLEESRIRRVFAGRPGKSGRSCRWPDRPRRAAGDGSPARRGKLPV